jgi:hypothetical protein
VVTEADIERYYCGHGLPEQTREALRPTYALLIRRWRDLGIAEIPVTLGYVTASDADRHLLERSLIARQVGKKAHEIRDMLAVQGLMGARHYKG